MSQTKIILDRQSDLVLTSPSISAPTGIIAFDILDSTNLTDVQSTLDSLGTSINNINTDISNNYSDLSNTISQEVSTLSTEISSVESTLSAAISQEVSDRGFVQGQLESADTSLSIAISNEVSNRQSVDESLSIEISTQIYNLVDGAPSILDTLNELAEAIGGDASFATTITSAQGSLSIAISNEVTDRQSVDESLSTAISNEVYTLSAAISQEVSDRGFVQGQLESADTSLSTAISNEVSNRQSVDESLSTEISNLPDVDDLTIEVDGSLIKLKDTVEAPTSGVRTFNGKIALGSSPASFDSLDLITKEHLSSEISTEVSDRQSADESLSTAISNEVTDRQSADESLSTAISNEVTDRESADTSLSIEISTQIYNLVDGAPSILDTLNELAEAIGGDASFATTITSAQGSLSTAISNEVTDRQSVDESLSTAISNEVSTLSAAISQEVSDRGFVQGQLESADTSLSTAISTEASTLSAAISQEVVDRQSADNLKLDLAGGTMSGNIDMGNSNAITNLPDPTADGDAANKKYVDDEIGKVLNDLDLSDIDSIADLANTFYQKVTFADAVDGMNATFTLSYRVNDGSESVYLNGLLQERGDDYGVTETSGKISVITFVTAPNAGSKVNIYGITNKNATDYQA